MEFISINEYFYKLFSRLLLMLMVPIFAFIALHFPAIQQVDDSNSSDNIHTYVIVSVACLWLVGIILSIKKIKSARKGQGLRAKLQKYFWITIVRYCLLAIVCLILAGGFLLTLEDTFTYAFLFHMLVAAIIWPHGPRVAQELKLRGDEREMVYYRKDSLS